jgi:hypothetical protein
MVATHTRVLDVQDRDVVVWGVSVSAKSICFARQGNVAILATRFALRALSDQRNSVFSLGLIRDVLPEAEARELKAVMMAERRLKGKRGTAQPGPLTESK